MAEFTELPSARGRLFSTDDSVDVPPGYFRSRTARPHLLRIAQYPSDTSLHRSRHGGRDPDLDPPNTKHTLVRIGRRQSVRRFTAGTLANTRDSAKRFLRFVTDRHTIEQAKASSLAEEESSNRHSIRLGRRPSARRAPPSATPTTSSATSSNPDMPAEHGTARPPSGPPALLAATGTAPSAGARLSTSGLADEIRNCDSASQPPPAAMATFPSPEHEKPVASGNGVSVSIALAEPMLFLQGFDQQDTVEPSTTMLRGSLHLRVSKSAKIKTIYLKFRGRAETDWPEGIPPRKMEFKNSETLMNHTWTFFNAAFPDTGHNADSVRPLKGPIATTREVSPGVTSFNVDPGSDRPSSRLRAGSPTPRELKRLSLQAHHHHHHSQSAADPTVPQKGYRLFTPGDYVYNFELPIDSRLPESIDVELGRVRYELEAMVERAGAFRANLVGSKDVTLIRAPAEGSLEAVEPIAISRDWEDQLHYDIVISGKSFPLGAQVPIAFKLTPLAKVQCHRLKVFVTENVQYFTRDKRVHRLEPTRRVQLFEKRADAPSNSAYPGSSLKITAGGGVAYDSRAAAAAGDESVPRDTTNLLGNLLGEHNVGPTELEVSVQLPSCHEMMEKERGARIHFDTTYTNIQVNHWIKIVMRLSRPDAVDSSKRRHFEISIDSPLNILSCRATQANISLPAYSSPESLTLLTDHLACGCPGAPRRRNSPPAVPYSVQPPPSHATSSNSSNPSNQNSNDRNSSTPSLPAAPAAARVHDAAHPTGGPSSSAAANNPPLPRPVHLLRAPSFNPPAFSDDAPPPPLVTPPPRYETLVGGNPQDALADYFARLADWDEGEAGGDDGDDDGSSGRGRVDVPLTPGGRVHRSMDVPRTWMPVGEGAR